MSEPQFIVGIDLGTTHCALAASSATHASVKLFDLPQLVAPGEVTSKPPFLLRSTYLLRANCQVVQPSFLGAKHRMWLASSQGAWEPRFRIAW